MSGLPIDIHQILAMPNAILAIVVVLGLAIFFHEAGHFLAARLFGIGVEEFSIGFGKALWQRRVGPTVYSLRVLPLGGFAKIAGMEEGETYAPGGIYTTPRYKQALVFAAGALMNVVLAMLMFTVVVFWKGVPDLNAKGIYVDRPMADSAAARAGFLSNDQIVALDGHRECLAIENVVAKKPAARGGIKPGMAIDYAGGVKVAVPQDLLKPIATATSRQLTVVVEDPAATGLDSFRRLTIPVSEEMRALAEFPPRASPQRIDNLVGQALGVKWQPMNTGAMADYIGQRPDVAIAVTVLRKGQEMVLRPVPAETYEREPVLGPNGELTTPHKLVGRIGVLLLVPHHKVGLVEGVQTAWYTTVGSVLTVVGALQAMATRQISPDVGGPVSIIAMTAEQAKIGWDAVLGLGGLISANLAVVNLFPFPPFDGFYLVMVGWEAITQRRISEKWRHAFIAAGLFLIICAFLLLTWRDALNLWHYRTP